MFIASLHSLENLLRHYGYPTVFIGMMLESIGLPLPGESLVIAAAIYAATKHELNIFLLVSLAAAGAIAGDQIGYLIGHSIGYRVLARWGRKVGLSDERLELGRFLFRKYGAVVVFFGRFVAVLRTFAALLAGANRMAWREFLLWNACGGICWAVLYGFGAYLLGDTMQRLSGPFGIGIAVLGAAALLAGFVLIKRNEAALLREAAQDMRRSGTRRSPSNAIS